MKLATFIHYDNYYQFQSGMRHYGYNIIQIGQGMSTADIPVKGYDLSYDTTHNSEYIFVGDFWEGSFYPEGVQPQAHLYPTSSYMLMLNFWNAQLEVLEVLFKDGSENVVRCELGQLVMIPEGGSIQVNFKERLLENQIVPEIISFWVENGEIHCKSEV